MQQNFIMQDVRAKKYLGQHFLKDQQIAHKIVEALSGHGGYSEVLEVGPGTGVLSDIMIAAGKYQLCMMDLDQESVHFLHQKHPALKDKIVYGDFLRTNIFDYVKAPCAIIGNFPYNISSQIFFKVLKHKQEIPEVVGMIQKEVADRLVSPPGHKAYGILSVLLQAFYDLEYLFTVEPHVFKPPPKVRSAVIRIKRNSRKSLSCDEDMFFKVVKQGFNNRRKTLRNALKPLGLHEVVSKDPLMDKRAEQLSVADFEYITKLIDEHRAN